MTTKEAAQMLGVGTTTVKRWADEGRLCCAKTAGKHRRFERAEVERLRQRQEVRASGVVTGAAASELERWTQVLLEQPAARLVAARLLEERARLGAWWRVADEVGVVITQLGELWQSGAVSVVQEHVATDALLRGLSSCAAGIPVSPAAPRCLLAAAPDELHVLGLHLVELCLREAGWRARWLGGYTPVGELERAIDTLAPQAVAVSASAHSASAAQLAAHYARIAAACQERAVELVLGGEGAWPEQLEYGQRLRSFAELRRWLEERAG